ncbi:TetR/AcrR family transcriptional regulator [Parapedobacter koreensis]|uniref:Transcriptional regulator, TetR family n=1 Tax=Parapedobacter koreensis TaxID=332977 RepID=A0A1H7LBG5_9SPHI|nr:TetR/AcrR family transcriptional regulator [Parapedobacter koreensis]SEK96166.1 transcriptional regulator, TetR family [Parapedobacter koreensis]
MGIKERKERHKEDLKAKILEAAKKLFVKEGYEATSIRKIAAEIEFSPTTIYLYYKDKTDIAYALHQEGFSLLRERLSALIYVEQPFERLKAMGRAYIQFALDHPDFYELMFIMKEPMEYLQAHHPEEDWPEGERVFDGLIQTVEACQKAGYFVDMNTAEVAMLSWSVVHGLCSLHITSHFKHIAEKCSSYALPEHEALLESIFQTYIRLLDGLK